MGTRGNWHYKSAILLTICATRLFAAASGSKVAVDGAGNVWLTGSGLPVATTPNAFQKTSIDSVCATQQISPFDQRTAVTCTHAYVIKQDSTGKILYATNLGGSSQDGGLAITTDAQGNAYVTGYTYSPDFPVTAGAAQTAFAGPAQVRTFINNLGPFGPIGFLPGGDAFVAKFGPDGTLLYCTLLGGSGQDIPSLIAVDAADSAYVAGTTGSADFPVTADAMSHASNVPSFFTRLNVQGAALVYSTYFDPTIQAFDVGAGGKAFLTGASTPASTAGPYVTEVATASGQIVYSIFLPAANAKFVGAGAAIAVNPAGTISLGISPAPQPGGSLIPATPPPLPLGASFLLELPGCCGIIAAETDFQNTQFDSILMDNTGDTYAFGHGTVALPASPNPPLLAMPCSSSTPNFVVESDPSGSVLAATLLRQGDGTGAAIASPGHLWLYHGLSRANAAVDLTSPPTANFGCLANLATNAIGRGPAPGEIFITYGYGIGPDQPAVATPDISGQYPTSLGGTQVSIGGTPAPLIFSQAGEIHGVVPFEAFGTTTIAIQYNGQNAPALDAAVPDNSPGVFSNNGQGAILNQDGTVNSPANPAKQGSIVSLYATGTGSLQNPLRDGQITPLPPPFILLSYTQQITIGGTRANILWAGSAPELIAGVAQINVQVPLGLNPRTPSAQFPLILTSGGAPPAPAVMISVAP